jgi:hypothetical protein
LPLPFSPFSGNLVVLPLFALRLLAPFYPVLRVSETVAFHSRISALRAKAVAERQQLLQRLCGAYSQREARRRIRSN